MTKQEALDAAKKCEEVAARIEQTQVAPMWLCSPNEAAAKYRKEAEVYRTHAEKQQ